MKYVRVMDGVKSNAGGFNYKIGEINVSEKWNPYSKDPKEFGGFNFGTEDKILRWIHRGNTLYDVIIPDDAEIILCSEEKGVYRSNKIILTNPRPLTGELIKELYNKTTLSNKVLSQCLQVLRWIDKVEIAKYIIKDRVNKSNVDEFITCFDEYVSNGNIDNNFDKTSQEIHDELVKIKEQ